MPNLLITADRAAELLENQKSQNEGAEGWYSDGAYTGLPTPSSRAISYHDTGHDASHEAQDSGSDIDPQEAYYTALLSRFSRLRETLQKPPSALPALKATISPSPATIYKAKQPEWSYALRYTAPKVRQLSGLDQEHVIRGLSRMEKLLTRKTLLRETESQNIGAWIWGLLGKCRSLGEMDGDEVAILRLLGKRAARVRENMRMDTERRWRSNGSTGNVGEGTEIGNAELEEGYEDEEDEGESIDRDREDLHDNTGTIERDTMEIDGLSNEPAPSKGLTLLEEAKKRMLDQISNRNGDVPQKSTIEGTKAEEVPNEGSEDGEIPEDEESEAREISSTRIVPSSRDGSRDVEPYEHDDLEARAFATLDIIVTLIGEFYGQRDLLDAREVWGEYE